MKVPEAETLLPASLPVHLPLSDEGIDQVHSVQPATARVAKVAIRRVVKIFNR